MKTVNIERISIEGFGNIQEEFQFNFHRPGISVVKGMNGAGKTTVYNALVWALYGVNLKGVNKDRVATWPHIRREGYKGTRVMVWFYMDAPYMVARHMDYSGTTDGKKGNNSLMVFKNGTLISTGVTDSNKLIEDILGINSKVFLNSVLFGQRMKKLIEADDAEKRKVFEEIFDTEWINALKDKAKLLKDKLLSELSNLIAEISKLEITFGETTQQLEDYKSMRDNFSNSKEQKVQELTDSILTTKSKLAIEKQLQEVPIEELKESVRTIQGSIRNMESEMGEYQVTLRGVTTTLKANEDKVGMMEEANLSYTKTFNENQARYTGKVQELTIKLQDAKRLLDETQQELSSKLDELNTCGGNGIPSTIVEDYNNGKNRTDRIVQELQSIDNSIKKGALSLMSLDVELARSTKQLDSMKCPTCGQDIQGDAWDRAFSEVEKIRQSKEKLEKQIQEYHLRHTELSSELLEASGELTRLESLCTARNNYLALQEGVKRIEQSLKDSQSVEQSIQHSLDEALENLNGTVYQLPYTDETIQELKTRIVKDTATKLDTMGRISELAASIRVNNEKYNTLLDDTERAQQSHNRAIELTSTLNNLEDKLQETQSSSFQYSGKIEELETKVQTIDNAIMELKESEVSLNDSIQMYTLWEKAFGNSGIKSYIFETMLAMLNNAMEKYAAQMGVRVRFSIDLDSARKGIVTQCFKEGGVVLYDDLSGGERQRVDIVQVFGMHDIISGNVLFNILLMDEIFENLDNEGVDEVFRLLHTKMGGNTSIYVITHQNELSTMHARTIVFKRNQAGTLEVTNDGN